MFSAPFTSEILADIVATQEAAESVLSTDKFPLSRTTEAVSRIERLTAADAGTEDSTVEIGGVILTVGDEIDAGTDELEFIANIKTAFEGEVDAEFTDNEDGTLDIEFPEGANTSTVDTDDPNLSFSQTQAGADAFTEPFSATAEQVRGESIVFKHENQTFISDEYVNDTDLHIPVSDGVYLIEARIKVSVGAASSGFISMPDIGTITDNSFLIQTIDAGGTVTYTGLDTELTANATVLISGIVGATDVTEEIRLKLKTAASEQTFNSLAGSYLKVTKIS